MGEEGRGERGVPKARVLSFSDLRVHSLKRHLEWALSLTDSMSTRMAVICE